MKRIVLFVILLTIISFSDAFCCTSGIFTGKVTPDGRPLLWKHRDTGEENNRIEFFKGEKYNFIALMNSPIIKRKEAWTGTNSTGFSIMNTASYNLMDLNDKTDTKEMDKEGEVMFEALSVCKDLKDFEEYLNNRKRPMGVEANFGVIDANGGAAYYEVNNYSWKKIDVNDPKIAPQGYLIYTNHSYTGRIDKGSGYIRYTTAETIVKKRIAQAGVITPEWIFTNLSRSFYHPVLEIDLRRENFIKNGNGWFVDQDFIPRKSSTASIVIKGVKVDEDPLNTVMWTVLGYPPVSVAVPLFVKAGENQPSFMIKSKDSNNALMCDMALKVKNGKVFTIKRGNGSKYFNFGFLYKGDGTGYMERMENIEDKIFVLANNFIKENNNKAYNTEIYNALYDNIFKIIEGD